MKTWKLCAIVGIFVMCAFGLVFMGCSDGGGGGGGEDSTPTAADFVIGNLSQVKESITAVTITPKSGKSRGAISVYYDGSATLPTKSGAYAVTFNVAAASGWKAANGLNAGTLIVNDIAVNSIDVLSTYLSDQTANTAGAPYYIALNIDDENGFTNLRTTLNNEADKYVYLDLSGSTITTIPENTFSGTGSPYGCATLIGITIPNSVTSIGDSAFSGCASLASVTIPDSVTSIGDSAFSGCASLASVIIPDSVTSIGYATFSSCTGLTSVTIPNSVTSIGDYAFMDCPSLTSVIIPNNVTSIGDMAFLGCTSIANITIPNNVTNIGIYVFHGCTSLTAINVDVSNSAYTAVDGVLYNKNKTTLIQYPAGKTGAFTIPDNVTNIEDTAFSYSANLESITIPNSITSIEAGTFYGCTNLTKVTIPNSITSIGQTVFYACTNLASVTFEGTIASENFSSNGSFFGDLRDKFYATDPTNGTPGTYTTTAPVGESSVWTKQEEVRR